MINKNTIVKIGCWLLPWMPLSYVAVGIELFRISPGHYPVPTIHFDGQGNPVSIVSNESEFYRQLMSWLPIIVFVATILFVIGLILLVVGLVVRALMERTSQPNA